MKLYKIIYADCPWQYQNFSDKKNGAVKAHYQTLSQDYLANLPIAQIADKNSLCFMWATFPKLTQALCVMEKWGFQYITTPFIWNKVYRDDKPYCGLGFWTRSGAEIVLMGKRGKGVPRLKSATNVRQVFNATVGGHSEKPEVVRDKIIQLVGDHPKIELFARKKISGWDVIGNAIDGKDINEALTNLIEEK